MKAVVFSLGCKVNQIEGQSLITSLEKNNIQATHNLEIADIYIINTCSVTVIADRKSRQAIARAQKLNKNAKIYVCGCSSQNDFKSYLNKDNICVIGGTSGKQDVVSCIMRDITSDPGGEPQILPQNLPTNYEDFNIPEHTKTRGFIKVQDGCDNFCSYCIVPYLRGRSRSRSIDSILAEANVLAKTCSELIISGINISDYGKNIGLRLVDLVIALRSVNIRKRFGSLECSVINQELLEQMRQSNFCDHFHLSLQSGSDSTLKRMNRHYNTDFFYSKVQLIRKYFPNAGITTDVIAGFSQETETEHLQTVEFIKKVKFSDAHVFAFSERKGTNAAKLEQVDSQVRDSRAKEITIVKEALKTEFLQSQLGKIYQVCVCDKTKNSNCGYTSNYIKVYCNEPQGTFAKYKLQQIKDDGVIGILV